MSSEDVVSYLLGKQSEERISATAMASRLGMGETAWCHVRRGRRRLTVAQIERAIQRYPEIRDILGQPEQPQAVAS